ncbi:MAG: DNA polymerase III subunit beta [Methylococcus sp.]
MKFSIARESFLAPLSHVASVIEKNQIIPILANVVLTVKEGWLELIGSDQEVQLKARVELAAAEDGAVTVPARRLLDIFRLLPDHSRVSFELRDDRLLIRSGSSRFNLITLPVENYPAFDVGVPELEVRVETIVFRKALEKTIFAIAQQDVRNYLKGLLIDFEGKTLRTVASDGHRLAVYQEVLPEAFGVNRQIILPRKGVLELYRLLGDADDRLIIQISPHTAHINLGSVTFSSKLIEGRYPDYQKVMPDPPLMTYIAARDEFKGALSRVALMTSEKQKCIGLEVGADGDMVLKGFNQEQDEAEERLTVDADGGPVSVGFNAAYLMDVVNHIDSKDFRLSFTSSATSCLVEDLLDTRFRYVVMPMRL